jgi:hypothetical protein
MLCFNIDLHISIIADMKKIFNDLGHQIVDKSLSDHTWVFNRKKDSVPMLDNGRWIGLSPDSLANEFYTTYKEELDKYDCFIVTYPPTFSLLYKHFNKPIIINSPIRYEWPFSFNKKYWEQFNSYLREGYDNGKIILVANNLYDKYYMELFIERPVIFIPSLCEYYPNGHRTGEAYQYLYYSRDKIKEINNNCFVFKNDVFANGHNHYDLMKYKAIMHMPYQISYMSIFEQYTYNMPLIVPSQEFLMKTYTEGSYNVLKEVSWNNYFNKMSYSAISANTTYDPNNYQHDKSVAQWLQYADYYDNSWMPHITYFNSFDELNDIYHTLDTDLIANNMKNFNSQRKEKIYQLWNSVLESI